MYVLLYVCTRVCMETEGGWRCAGMAVLVGVVVRDRNQLQLPEDDV